MKKIINVILLGLRYILFLGAFAISFYIVLSMYKRLSKTSSYKYLVKKALIWKKEEDDW